MDIDRLAHKIWRTVPGITFEKARQMALSVANVPNTREDKQVRVIRAKETR